MTFHWSYFNGKHYIARLPLQRVHTHAQLQDRQMVTTSNTPRDWFTLAHAVSTINYTPLNWPLTNVKRLAASINHNSSTWNQWMEDWRWRKVIQPLHRPSPSYPQWWTHENHSSSSYICPSFQFHTHTTHTVWPLLSRRTHIPQGNWLCHSSNWILTWLLKMKWITKVQRRSSTWN